MGLASICSWLSFKKSEKNDSLLFVKNKQFNRKNKEQIPAKKWLSTGMAYVSKACVKPLWKEWPIYSYKGKACNKNRFTKLQIKLATKSGSPSLNHEGKACKMWLLKSWKWSCEKWLSKSWHTKDGRACGNERSNTKLARGCRFAQTKL